MEGLLQKRKLEAVMFLQSSKVFSSFQYLFLYIYPPNVEVFPARQWHGCNRGSRTLELNPQVYIQEGLFQTPESADRATPPASSKRSAWFPFQRGWIEAPSKSQMDAPVLQFMPSVPPPVLFALLTLSAAPCRWCAAMDVAARQRQRVGCSGVGKF